MIKVATADAPDKEAVMNRILLLAGGLLNLLLAIFKIAMPHLFHWRDAMGSSEAHMWATVYAENLGISMLLLFFAYMSIFQWRVFLFLTVAACYLLPLGRATGTSLEKEKFRFTRQSMGKSHE